MNTEDRIKAGRAAIKIVENHLLDYDKLPENTLNNIILAVQHQIIKHNGGDIKGYLFESLGSRASEVVLTQTKFKASKFISKFFVWSCSENGYEYWFNLHSRLTESEKLDTNSHDINDDDKIIEGFIDYLIESFPTASEEVKRECVNKLNPILDTIKSNIVSLESSLCKFGADRKYLRRTFTEYFNIK